MIDYKGNRRLTPAGALSAIDPIKSQNGLNPEQHRLLDDLAAWVRETYTM